MAVKTPEEYNKYLVDNNIDINIIDYVKEINKLIYKMDISFIDNFLNLVGKNEICIPHKYLIDYGIITEDKSSHIIRILNQFNPVENVDYNLADVGQVRKNRGSVIKKEYTLHPRLFKLCLIRSKNTLVYAMYYLLLEECVKYYDDYQKLMLKNDNKKLHNKLDITNNELKEIKEQNTQILNELKETKNELIETKEICENLQDDMDVVYNKLDERVPNAKTDIISERFVVLKHDDKKKYYIIARKERTIKTTLDRLKKSGYNDVLIEFKCCPNSRLLLNDVKDKMLDYYKFITNGNCREFNLLKTEQEYIDKLTEIYNSRRE